MATPPPAASARQLMKRALSAMQKHRAQEALDCLGALLAIQPQHAEALHHVGYILHSGGNYEQAHDYYQRAIAADATHIDSYLMLCKLFEAQNRGNEAIELAQRATQIAPNNPKTHGELTTQLMCFNQAHMVPAYLEQVLPRFPDDATLKQFYAFALKVNDRRSEAESVYQALLKAHRVPESFRILYELYLPRLHDSAEDIDAVREAFEASVDRLIAQKPRIDIEQLSFQPIFQLAFHHRDNKALMQKYIRMLRSVAPMLTYTAPHCKAALTRDDSTIRVGFVSRYMYHHSVGSCYRQVMIDLAHEPGFSVTFFNLAHVMDDKIQQIIDANVPIVSLPKTIASAREAIAAHALDILVYPDIGMDAMTHYLAMARLAPHQCCLQGHPDTTGIDTIDYFISTRGYEHTGAQARYSERLLCREGIDTLFARPTPPSAWLTRAALKLPLDKKLYVCPMAIQKFHPDFDGVLADILMRDEQAVIVLFQDFQQQQTSNALQQRITRRCDPARVIFMPWLPLEALFSVMNTADALLDTIYFGAGSTAQYAFGLGLPIVTLPDEYMRGRVVQAYYRLMGITDAPIATSLADYAAKAVALAHNPAEATRLRGEISAKNHALFERPATHDSFAQLMRDILDQRLDAYAPP